MSKSLNMSEYQKVIFVNNIDEGMLPANGISMKQLSEKYPFAVFFTNDTTRDHAGNIWSNGERLTRFIDIDEEHNTIQIGEHQLILRYNHDTGKIGIYDANPLKSIEIESISFYDAFTDQYVTLNAKNVTIDNIFEVNPKDNTFIIAIRFDIDSTTANADINAVNKEVKAYEGSASTEDILLQHFDPLTASTKLQQVVNFKYLVVVPSLSETGANMKENTYKFVSLYVSSAYDELKMKIYKNPVAYNINYEYTQDDRPHTAVSVGNQSTIYAEAPDKPRIQLNITDPVSITSYDNCKIIAKITVNNNLVTFSGSNECEVYGNEIVFNNINVGPIEMNSSERVTYTIEFFREENGTKTRYPGLTKSFTVVYEGVQSSDLYYIGYSNPTESGFPVSEFKAIGDTVLYNHRNTNISTVNSKKFYIAVPADSNIFPRLEIYDKDGGIKNENAFVMSTVSKTIGRATIEFRVYESKTFTGNYIGLVQ